MEIVFSDKQKELIGKLEIGFDVSSDLSDDDICEVHDVVADYLILHCLDDEYKPNDEGDICYEILDIIGEI